MSKGKEHFDVIVIGGGPAGSTASTLIAKQGYRVRLFEGQTLPTYKIGESLLPATVHGICPLLGVSKELNEAKFMPKKGGTFLWGKSKTPWTFSFSSSPKMAGPNSTAYQVERMKFDKILLDNAKRVGVDVKENHKVVSLIIEDRQVKGVQFTDNQGESQEGYARFVVDASGHQSTFYRHAGERIFSTFFQNVALFGYYRGAKRLPSPQEGNIFCVAFKHGWFWYIPLTDDLTSVGAVIAKDAAPQLQEGYESALEAFIRDCPQIQEMLSGASRITSGPYGEVRVRKDYSYANKKFWSDGLMLIGDAACFIDPVFSSGVHLATYSGLLAARSINTILKGQISEEKCLNEFENRYRREYSFFFDFLRAFYSVNEDANSYFWEARKVTGSTEQAEHAFLDLVGGVASQDAFWGKSTINYKDRERLGRVLFPQAVSDIPAATDPQERSAFLGQLLGELTQVQLQSSYQEARPQERPLFPGGLVPSRDGLNWCLPS